MAVLGNFVSWLCSISVLSTLPRCVNSESAVTLTTTLGEVSGVRKSVIDSGAEVEVFYNIPFAEPPINELRFRSPVAATAWTGVRNGTTQANSCWQLLDPSFDGFKGVSLWNTQTPFSEDCLYLNVFRPATADSTTSPKTIMVWIHGGAFVSGGASVSVYDGSYLASRNDVIVVFIQYRLGPFGFLYLGNDDVPGNAGLLDQVMALQWVKDNAVNLGGSPDDISIFGESAGAASVGLHLFSPLSQDLYNYAILQSASPLADWAVMDTQKARDRTEILASILQCSGSDEEIFLCLQNANPLEMTYMQFLLIQGWFDIPLGPVVDNNFLLDYPKNLLERGEVKNTSILLGINTDEGAVFTIYAFSSYFPLEGDGQVTEDQCSAILQKMTENTGKNQSDVQAAYFGFLDANATYSDVIIGVASDTLINVGVLEFAEEYTKAGGQVYLYSFEHRVSTNPWPEWTGIPHLYEMEITFGLSLATDSEYSDEDREVSMRVMDHWTNLAKTGNPNSADTTWPQHTIEGGEYEIFDSQGERHGQYLRKDNLEYWTS